jgi:hypothetical protein
VVAVSMVAHITQVTCNVKSNSLWLLFQWWPQNNTSYCHTKFLVVTVSMVAPKSTSYCQIKFFVLILSMEATNNKYFSNFGPTSNYVQLQKHRKHYRRLPRPYKKCLTCIHMLHEYIHIYITYIHTYIPNTHTIHRYIHTYVTCIHTYTCTLHTYITYIHTYITYIHTYITYIHTLHTYIHYIHTYIHTYAHLHVVVHSPTVTQLPMLSRVWVGK